MFNNERVYVTNMPESAEEECCKACKDIRSSCLFYTIKHILLQEMLRGLHTNKSPVINKIIQ